MIPSRDRGGLPKLGAAYSSAIETVIHPQDATLYTPSCPSQKVPALANGTVLMIATLYEYSEAGKFGMYLCCE